MSNSLDELIACMPELKEHLEAWRNDPLYEENQEYVKTMYELEEKGLWGRKQFRYVCGIPYE